MTAVDDHRRREWEGSENLFDRREVGREVGRLVSVRIGDVDV
jgi:hypothetical protein